MPGITVLLERSAISIDFYDDPSFIVMKSPPVEYVIVAITLVDEVVISGKL